MTAQSPTQVGPQEKQPQDVPKTPTMRAPIQRLPSYHRKSTDDTHEVGLQPDGTITTSWTGLDKPSFPNRGFFKRPPPVASQEAGTLTAEKATSQGTPMSIELLYPEPNV